MGNDEMNQRGGISVMFSLILVVLIAFVGSMIDLARFKAAGAKVAISSKLAMDSTFSNFAKEVFEDYGIFVLWKNEGSIENMYEKYMLNNLSLDSKAKAMGYSQAYKLKIQNITWETEKDGNDVSVIADQIYDLMKYKVATDTVEYLISQCTSLSQGKSVAKIFDNLESCSNKVQKVEESVGKIHDAIIEVQEITKKPADYVNEMYQKLKEIKNMVDSYEKNARFEEFKKIYVAYYEEQVITGKCLKDMEDATDEYYSYVAKANKEIADIEYQLRTEKDTMQPDVYETVEKEVQQLKKQAADVNSDAYLVNQNWVYTSKYKDCFESMNNSTKELTENMEGVIYNNLTLSSFDKEGEYVDLFIMELENCYGFCEQLDNSKFKVSYEVKEVQKGDDGILGFIDTIASQGILGIVAPNCSTRELKKEKTIDMEQLVNTGNVWKNDNAATKQLKSALLGQYILDYFVSYVDSKSASGNAKGKKHVLDYEIEYMIAGEEDDKSNLKEVVDDIVLIREGFNLISLYKDSAKREETLVLATSLVGFTGLPIVIYATQFIIMSAWAYAESLADVEALLSGKKIKLIKNSGDWSISLTNVGELANKDNGCLSTNDIQLNEEKNSEIDEEKYENSGNGLGYKDYLRFLLFTQNPGKVVARVMNVIQCNVIERYNDAFVLGDCIMSATVQVECSMDSLFGIFSFINYYRGSKKNYYLESIISEGY